MHSQQVGQERVRVGAGGSADARAASVELTAFKSSSSQPYSLGIPRPSGRLRLREGGRLP